MLDLPFSTLLTLATLIPRASAASLWVMPAMSLDSLSSRPETSGSGTSEFEIQIHMDAPGASSEVKRCCIEANSTFAVDAANSAACAV